MKVAIIGTAGRDKSNPMKKSYCDFMRAELSNRLTPLEAMHGPLALVSGGAAWAERLAVDRFLTAPTRRGIGESLILHLPAPFWRGGYVGGYGTSNYYHSGFSRIAEIDSLKDISDCKSHSNFTYTFQDESRGYSAMYARNQLIAKELEKWKTICL